MQQRVSQLIQVACLGCRRLVTSPHPPPPLHSCTSAHTFSEITLLSRGLLRSSSAPPLLPHLPDRFGREMWQENPGLFWQPPGIKVNQSQPLTLRSPSLPQVLASSFELQGDPKKLLLILIQGVKLKS